VRRVSLDTAPSIIMHPAARSTATINGPTPPEDSKRGSKQTKWALRFRPRSDAHRLTKRVREAEGADEMRQSAPPQPIAQALSSSAQASNSR